MFSLCDQQNKVKPVPHYTLTDVFHRHSIYNPETRSFPEFVHYVFLAFITFKLYIFFKAVVTCDEEYYITIWNYS